jgi:UDP-3-O-[3-hydroxymyristoyl] N-acetylglucosamine deacetylase
LTIVPAAPNSGVVFHRVDLGVMIPARFDLVAETHLCTLVASASDPSVRVGTIEHVMAALAASGIDNAVLELDGPELPIMDGSAQPFMMMIERAGIAAQTVARRAIEVRRHVRVTEGAAFAELSPSPGFLLDLSIDFEATAIGKQSLRMERIDQLRFRTELADCRTFAMARDIERLRDAGLALGGSLDNAIVVEGDRILNEGGLRRPDEFVRHKMLDAIGDLALAGHPIQGRFTGYRSGHGLNNRVLKALFANRLNWALVDPAQQGSALESQAA